MKDKIFGSLHPYFEQGHINGRTMANAGFMTALLQRDPFAEYHFFVAQPDALAEYMQKLPLTAIQRGAVHTFHRTVLPQALRHNPYGLFHFSDPVSEYVPLCQARNVWAPEIFPVTAVNHTISYVHYNSAFLQHLWQGVCPRDAIGCNSQAAQAVLEQNFACLRRGYHSSACAQAPALHIVPMGVDPCPLDKGTLPPLRRTAMRAQLQATENTVLLLLFGRISLTDKLAPTPLLLALRRAREEFPQHDLRLVMAGYTRPEDSALDYLRAVATLLKISLTLLPNPTDEEKYALFAAADVFVSPSDNIQETFGLSLLEAGAAALPCVVSDWDGYRDIIVHGHTGLLVPTLAPAATPELDLLSPLLFDNQQHLLRSQQSAVSVPELAAAISQLAGDAKLRATMGAQARAHVLKHFTWDAVLDKWLILWNTLRSIPLDAATIDQLRAHKHPAHLPVGEIYAPYASQSLAPNQMLRCSTVGEAVRKGSLPFEAFSTMGDFLNQAELMPLLVWARKGISFQQLATRATEFSSEKLVYYVLWALKHDLLELCTSADSKV